AICFFFPSRRRHTRWVSDWSSDVCSSDLRRALPARRDAHAEVGELRHREVEPARRLAQRVHEGVVTAVAVRARARAPAPGCEHRSEEHTSELQSLTNLVCRLLLAKKNAHR